MKTHKPISASTLPELLVLMILCGILFLCVMDGMQLIASSVRSITQRITQRSQLYVNYHRIEGLIARADSLHSQSGKLEIYSQGDPFAILERRDSLLLVQLNKRIDTCFTSLIDWDTLSASDPWAPRGIDSLKIHLRTPADSVITLSFARFRLIDLHQQALWQLETRYRYEN